ncbi:MAG: DUF4115 domain-containing protein [Alicyclobacillus macrosporangiidus]|uniref:helix-turn-helix domain-containing protein n=1 Tax=Alicyclobacillus macrosporangiidus TaxID=392015 RepID=UPI0026F04381|nr:RodZ domain-containing protein [Alicyclobacillus macrosporangiidus]MCL6597305.1 DUF4115 domain-containing protein [Alicyclobacillus macrosporangiidus]
MRDLRALGVQLREQRLRLGIELDELQAATKIRKRYLEALESGDWSILPGDVYARGFVRSYAEAVGLDGRQLLEAYVDGPAEEMSTDPVSSVNRDSPAEPPSPRPDVRPAHVVAEPDQERRGAPGVQEPAPDPAIPDTPAAERGRGRSVASRAPSRQRRQDRRPVARSGQAEWRGRDRARTSRGGWGWNAAGQAVAVVAVLAGLAGAWWYLERPGRGATGTRANETAVRGGVTSGSGGNAVQNAVGPAGNSAGNTVVGSGSPNPAGNTTNAAGGGTAGQPELRVVGQTFSNHQQTYVVSTTGPMVAQLTASTGACWVRATVDGKVVDPSDTIPVGQSRTWQGSQQIRIRVGFVPGVTLTLNGQPLALPDTKDAIDVVIIRGQD